MQQPPAAARVLRPRAIDDAPWRCTSLALPERGLVVVRGREEVGSDQLAASLAADEELDATVWLRLDPLDVAWGALLGSVFRASEHAGHTISASAASATPRSAADVGRALAVSLATVRTLVVEDDLVGGADFVVDVLEVFVAASDGPVRAVYVPHRSAPFRLMRRADVVVSGVTIAETRAALHAVWPAASSVTVLRLATEIGGRGALLADIADVVTGRDPELVTHLARGVPWRRRSLLDRIDARLLPVADVADLRALATASSFGYWHADLTGRDPTKPLELRPWMIELEGGWWWMRPMWRRPLERWLDPAHRSARRFLVGHPALSESGGRVASRVRTERGLDLVEPLERGSRAVGGVSTAARGVRETAEEADDHVVDGRAPTSDVAGPEVTAATGGDPRRGGPAARPQVLCVRLLGVVDVVADDAPVPAWHGRLGRSIFAYVLLSPQHVAARDRLVDVFWPDTDPEVATNRLRVAISALRRDLRAATAKSVITCADGNYRVAPSWSVDLDVHHFERSSRSARRTEASGDHAAALGLYQTAIRLYRGELLSEMPFEEWTVLPREALRVAYVECLRSAASLHLRRGEHVEALGLGWSILASDPAREDAHRLIMRCHAAMGELNQVRRQFELCRRELGEALGVEPEPETVELLHHLAHET